MKFLDWIDADTEPKEFPIPPYSLPLPDAEARRRLEEKRDAAKQYLGEKWVGIPQRRAA
jgi:hypothetical protein